MHTHRYEATVEFDQTLDHLRDDPETLDALATKEVSKSVIDGPGMSYEIEDVTVETDPVRIRVVIAADGGLKFRFGRFRRHVIAAYNERTDKPSLEGWKRDAPHLAKYIEHLGCESLSDVPNFVDWRTAGNTYSPSKEDKRQALKLVNEYRNLPESAPDLPIGDRHFRTLAGEVA